MSMQANLEVKEGLNRSIKVKVPAKEYQEKQQTLLKKKAKTAKVDGFRPGKAPAKVIEQIYGAMVAEQALEELISKTLYDACDQEKVVPVNTPKIESLNAEPGKDIEYIAVFEVAPEVNQINFDNVTIEKVEAKVTDADVNLVLENLRKQFGQFVPKLAGAAEKGDRVNINFLGKIDGVPFDGGKAENFQLVLGSSQMVPGFEDAIEGMKIGDEKVITVTFPENYHAELAGKKADFDIKLNAIDKQELAELNDDFAKRLGIKEGGIEKLKQEITRTLTRELSRKLRSDLNKTVFDQLLALNDIEVPPSVVHHEIHELMKQAQERFQQMTGGREVPKLPHEMFEGEAKRRVQLSYLVQALIKLHEMKSDAVTVRKLAEEMAEAYENPEQVRDYFLNDREQFAGLQSLALEQAVVDKLLEKATVKTIEKSHKDVMGNQAQ